MLTANLYVLMVAQLELLKQDFRELATSVKESGSEQKYSSPQVIKYTEAVLQTEVNFETLISIDKKKETLEINDFSDNSEKLDKILNDRVIMCTLRYQAIVKFVNDVTELFQIGVVAQVCASSIIICATSYEMTSISPTSLQFYVILQYQMCMLFQIFIYLYRGNDITLKTTEMKDAVYDCAWISIPNSKFRRSLCIIMSQLQVPIKLNVGKFFVLSIDTFFGIIKLAYSFFVLLKQVNDRKSGS
ncbi:odorant receptor Or1-like [Leptopilina heterotoma]|uniref:odorant receptor Or1-like n=1 Tax=Leptopilina heterotoma TaxID=63436 RepID=UPI001CA9683B|nr:odorant receptor Or1-like [Leptopilina heterotoma]